MLGLEVCRRRGGLVIMACLVPFGTKDVFLDMPPLLLYCVVVF